MHAVTARGIAVDSGVVQLEQYVASKLLFFGVENDNNPKVEAFLVKRHGADPRSEGLDSNKTALSCAMLQKKD